MATLNMIVKNGGRSTKTIVYRVLLILETELGSKLKFKLRPVMVWSDFWIPNLHIHDY